jgi:hypothetical protein
MMEFPDSIAYVLSLRRIAPVERRERLPLQERCPVLHCSIASVCTYAEPDKTIVTKVTPYKLRESLVTQHVTQAGNIDGRCLTRAKALEKYK